MPVDDVAALASDERSLKGLSGFDMDAILRTRERLSPGLETPPEPEPEVIVEVEPVAPAPEPSPEPMPEPVVEEVMEAAPPPVTRGPRRAKRVRARKPAPRRDARVEKFSPPRGDVPAAMWPSRHASNSTPDLVRNAPASADGLPASRQVKALGLARVRDLPAMEPLVNKPPLARPEVWPDAPPTDAMKRRQAWDPSVWRAALRLSIHQSPSRRAKACARRLCVPSSPSTWTAHTPVCSPRTTIRPQRLLSRRRPNGVVERRARPGGLVVMAMRDSPLRAAALRARRSMGRTEPPAPAASPPSGLIEGLSTRIDRPKVSRPRSITAWRPTEDARPSSPPEEHGLEGELARRLSRRVEGHVSTFHSDSATGDTSRPQAFGEGRGGHPCGNLCSGMNHVREGQPLLFPKRGHGACVGLTSTPSANGPCSRATVRPHGGLITSSHIPRTSIPS